MATGCQRHEYSILEGACQEEDGKWISHVIVSYL
jgi:hypothetical protein